MSSIIKGIEPQIAKLVTEAGYELYDMEFTTEGENKFFRVYIDSVTDTKITIEDCIKANSTITKFLDQEDPIKEAYMLEVSSPGIIRKLKKVEHFNKEINREIMIKTKNKIEEFESKKHNGILEQVDENGITIDGVYVEFEQITKAETTFKF